MSNALRKLREFNLWQVIAIYVGAGWAILQATDLFIDRLGFAAWLFPAAFVILLVGLPVILATALVQRSARLTQRLSGIATPRWSNLFTWRNAMISGVLAFALLGAAGLTVRAIGAFTGGSEKWARTTGMEELSNAVDSADWEAAWPRLIKLEPILKSDSSFQQLRNIAATRVTIRTQPVGASVFQRFYSTADTTWELVGTTPLDSVWFPNGTSQVRIELPGYRTVYLAGSAMGPPFFRKLDRVDIALDPDASIPAEMVRIPGGPVTIQNPPLDAMPPLPLSDYLMDRYEVTNGEYKRFVDAGGYQRRDYWKHDLQVQGRKVSWEEGMKALVDRSGRPGPSTWEAGDYPDGEDEFPVSGVSWYEAAAYAEFAGKSLPTIYHWSHAASTPMSASIVPRSNFANRALRSVASSTAMGWYGTFDQAGNVREWCSNESNGQRYIMGGGWSDPAYYFNDAYTQPPWDRSSINGIRLVRYLGQDNLAVADKAIALPHRDFRVEKPVSDEIFAVYRRQYDYDHTPLNERTEAVDSTSGDWIKERVSFDAAYNGPRMLADLYVPRRSTGPLQIVIFFPPGNALQLPSADQIATQMFDFMTKSGRVVVVPVYRGTFERGHGTLRSDYPEPTVKWRDHVIMWGKDYRRTIDYLETRSDLDASKVAYYGLSFGGGVGPTIAAIEPRTKAVVLNVGGLNFQQALPEVDEINYAPRVKQPTLMLNGRYDHFYPVETSQLPLFRLLGTPAQDKRHVIFEGGHQVPRPDVIRETLAWLDRYLGPVNLSANR